MDVIRSRRNSAITDVRKLKRRDARDARGLAFVEGGRLVKDALDSDICIKTMYFSESFTKSVDFGLFKTAADRRRIKIVYVSDDVFGVITDTMNPQGLLAVIGTVKYGLGDLTGGDVGENREACGDAGENREACGDASENREACGDVGENREACGDIGENREIFRGFVDENHWNKKPGYRARKKILILDRVADPGNLGGMLRTAEAAGFSGVILSRGCVDVYEPKAARASMGALFRIPFLRDADLLEIISKLRKNGFHIYASVARGDNDCFSGEIHACDVALVIGNEASGTDERVIAECDSTLSVPMPGGAESLNAGVAAGILMYEILRREKYSGG